MSKELGYLVCGELKAPSVAKSALTQLSSAINEFSERSISYYKRPPTKETYSFGPFCSRVLLENACAALVGRLDAFRLSYLSEFQSRPEYELGRRARSSFAWSGDVIPDNESQDMWSLNHDLQKISRALLSKYADHIFWRPAIDRMLDFVASKPFDQQLPDVAAIDPETFIASAKGRGSQLHSTLSKGVHWEFFSSALIFDESTIKNLIRETCVLVSQLGLISHFIPTAYASLSPARALNTYLAFRRKMP